MTRGDPDAFDLVPEDTGESTKMVAGAFHLEAEVPLGDPQTEIQAESSGGTEIPAEFGESTEIITESGRNTWIPAESTGVLNPQEHEAEDHPVASHRA